MLRLQQPLPDDYTLAVPAELEARIASPGFYREAADAIAAALARLDAVHQQLVTAYARWDALDSRS